MNVGLIGAHSQSTGGRCRHTAPPANQERGGMVPRHVASWVWNLRRRVAVQGAFWGVEERASEASYITVV